jgi:hypothetical protein
LLGKLKRACSRSHSQAKTVKKAPYITEPANLVVLQDNIRIQRPGEYIIRGKIQTKCKGIQEQKLFSPNLSKLMKKNLIAASSLVKHGVDGMIPVRIMATEPVTLHKGTSLGIVECFEMNECIRSLGVE